MIRILTQTQYNAILDLMRESDQEIAALKGQVDDLLKQNNKLRKENSILNHAISSHDIDFPNSSIRSSDLYDPIDKLF